MIWFLRRKLDVAVRKPLGVAARELKVGDAIDFNGRLVIEQIEWMNDDRQLMIGGPDRKSATAIRFRFSDDPTDYYAHPDERFIRCE